MSHFVYTISFYAFKHDSLSQNAWKRSQKMDWIANYIKHTIDLIVSKKITQEFPT